tara:strand:- start:185 stop:856 length:672 start_codon:yes stop_codon:yes gene_type:complete
MIKKILTKFFKSIIYTYLEKGIWDKDITSEKVKYITGIHNLFIRTKNIPGHIIELGTGSGRNAIIFGNFIKLYNLESSKKYFGFDTFSGYPKEVINKNQDFDKNTKNIFETVNLKLLNEKLKDECKIIKGDLPNSLKDFFESRDKFRKEYLKISIVYIDCNDYKTALDSLEILFPYFSKGCILAVDENTIGGETKALEEFCNKKSLTFKNGDFNGIISSYTQI